MKRISIVFLALLALSVALPAAAQLNMSSVYVGGSLGQAKAKDSCSGCDDKDTTWGVFGGYRVNRYVAAELGYHDLGSYGPIDANAWELVGVGSWPITDQFSVYGKLGGYRGKFEGAGASESNTDLTYGLGLQFDLNKNVGLRGEWQRYPSMGGGAFNNIDVDVLRVSALWNFR